MITLVERTSVIPTILLNLLHINNVFLLHCNTEKRVVGKYVTVSYCIPSSTAGEMALSIPEISPTSCNEGYFFAISSLVVGIIMT